ncbi:TonB-dependent receptor, partial [Klebsiella pneumoniae]|nr:TonB-dependent receptor [Klebsiella pneumoniae]
KPETSWNYEVGTHLNLFDDKLHADLTGFYMQVRDQQLSVMAGNYGFGRMMVNAGKSYSCGVEASLRGQTLDGHLSWAATYG